MEEIRTKISLRILDTLTNALYENPISVFREYVQNSLDGPNGENIKNGRKIKVDISFSGEGEDRTISIIDDGPGMERGQFTDQMANFSSNKFGSRSVGFRGIGRISAMPFCKKLVFETRSESSGEVSRCEFDGSGYSEMLDKSPDTDLGEALTKLLKFCPGNPSPTVEGRSHYFAVFIEGYDSVLGSVIGESDRDGIGHSPEFMEKLSSLLPVDYSSDFPQSKLIKDKYRSVFGHGFDTYVCEVFLDGNPLFKRYRDDLIGDSGIKFKRFAVPDPNDGDKMKVVALAWFSFNDFATCLKWKKNGVEGFIIRSKNIAMGDKNSLGIHAINNVSTFTTTPRETLAAIAGFSGEFLFDTDLLEDDAKRDWFKPTRPLSYLMGSIASFLRTARKCRYALSEMTSKDSSTAEKRLRENLRELVEEDQFEEFIVDYVPKNSERGRKKKKTDDGNEKGAGDDLNDDTLSLADRDIPGKPAQIKEFYNGTMNIIEGMVEEKKIKRITFIEMRLRIRDHYRKDCDGNDGEHPPGGA